jgi:hypothetical protein
MKNTLISISVCFYLIATFEIGVSFSILREFSNSKVNIENGDYI